MAKIARVTVERETIDRIEQLALALESLEQVVPGSIDLGEILRRFPQGPAALNLYFTVAGIAGDQRVVLEPCDFESDLMAAMRAFDRKRH